MTKRSIEDHEGLIEKMDAAIDRASALLESLREARKSVEQRHGNATAGKKPQAAPSDGLPSVVRVPRRHKRLSEQQKERVRYLWDTKAMSQSAMADMLGVSVTTIARALYGQDYGRRK